MLLLSTALILVLRPPGAPYLDLLRQGDALAAQAKRTAAIGAYMEAAHLRPQDPDPYLRMAQVYLDWGRIDEAQAMLAQAERLGAEAVALARLQMDVHAARGDWPLVATHARRLLSIAPGDSTTRHNLARAYLELQEWDLAQAEYETALRADRADKLAHERLGALLLGDDPSATGHLEAANTELAARLLASFEEARAVDDPAYPPAVVGRVLFEAQEWALAARKFQQALGQNPDYPDAHAYLGHALRQMGHPEEALPHLLRAVELAPASVVAHTFLGLFYKGQGGLAAARAEFETAYDLDPDNAAPCVEIGESWAVEGRYTAAEIWLRQAVALQPGDPRLWEVLARFYLDHDITADARGLEATAKLVELVPGDARAHDLSGWAAFQVGDYNAARASLERAISLDPGLPSAHYHLGRLWMVEGSDEEAREAFVRALDLDTTGALEPLVERALDTMP